MRRTYCCVVLILAVAVGYVFGTFPSADIAAHLATGGEHDIRTLGSGNPGAANVRGQLGTKWGLFVLVLDVAKGALACAIGRWMVDPNAGSIAGTAAVVGHCFPLWNGFRGGKGVAAGVGQVLATFPIFFPIDGALAIVTSRRSWRQRAFAATAITSAAWVGGAALWWAFDLPNLWGPKPNGALVASAAASSLVILYRFATAKDAPSGATPRS